MKTNARLSYSTGFARCAAESAYPEYWRGLVGCWCPSLGVTGNLIRDWSGHHNHGTNNGADWTVGKYGPCLDFNGSSDYVNCGHDVSLGTPGSFSVEALVRATNNIIYRGIAQKNWNDSTSWSFMPYNGALDFNLKCAGVYQHNMSPTAMSLNKWYHVVGVFVPNDRLDTYQNGVCDHGYTTLGAVNPIAADLFIGCGGKTPSCFHSGDIAKFCLYNRALSDSQVRQLYADPFCLFRKREQQQQDISHGQPTHLRYLNIVGGPQNRQGGM